MYALLTSTGVVAISEVGDKMQLLALLLASHFPQTSADRAPHFSGERVSSGRRATKFNRSRSADSKSGVMLGLPSVR
jgi:hypothetical protein